MTKKELVKRYILFVISLFFLGVGVALTKHSGLGVSPVSSVANIMSCKFTSISIGNWLIIWNCCLVIGEILILRKNFKPIDLLQIPLSLLLGYFTDIGMYMVSFIPTSSYIIRISLVIVGVIVLGFSISLAVIANAIMNAGEAFVKIVADALHKNFGNVKVAFDICCVSLSIILSLIFFDFSIVGTREGTLISAICTGLIVKWFTKRLHTPVTKLLTDKK